MQQLLRRVFVPPHALSNLAHRRPIPEPEPHRLLLIWWERLKMPLQPPCQLPLFDELAWLQFGLLIKPILGDEVVAEVKNTSALACAIDPEVARNPQQPEGERYATIFIVLNGDKSAFKCLGGQIFGDVVILAVRQTEGVHTVHIQVVDLAKSMAVVPGSCNKICTGFRVHRPIYSA